MKRMSLLLVTLASLGWGLVPGTASAGPGENPRIGMFPAKSTAPMPNLSNVPDALTLTPDGGVPFTIYVEGDLGPVGGAFVELEISPDAEDLVAWGTGQPHPILSGFTDANGEITFHLQGAGCIDPDHFIGAAWIAQVRADGIVLDDPWINSPDAVNSEGKLPTELGAPICEEGTSQVALSDAVFHTAAIRNGLVAPCTKVTPPYHYPVGVADAVILTPYIKVGGILICE